MAVPSFFIYGEPDKPLDVGFMHVETIMERRYVHHGHAAAHKHNQMTQIALWTSGGGIWMMEDEKLEFTAPAVSFVPSGVVHGFTVAAHESDAIVVSVADGALPPIRALTTLNMTRPVMIRGMAGNPLWPHLTTVMRLLHDDYRSGRAAALAALVAVAANDIAGLLQSDIAGERISDSLANAFRRLVDRHFRENWPVERYIDTLGTTPHLLDKACRNAHGLSVKAFIDERRLLEAKRLLLFTVRSVEDVAYETGFRDPAYFSRFFRRRAGAPPGQWRAERTGSGPADGGLLDAKAHEPIYAGIET